MLRNKNSIKNCWEQFFMLCEKKICKMHIKLTSINILAYLFSFVNNKNVTKKEREVC